MTIRQLSTVLDVFVSVWNKPCPILTALLVSGCSMADSSLLPSAKLAGCHSDLGAYSLPQHFLYVQVTGDRIEHQAKFAIQKYDDKTGDGESGAAISPRPAIESDEKLADTVPGPAQKFDGFNVSFAGGPVAKPDRSRMFCLDFLDRITSNDLMKVKRENGILEFVTTTQKSYDTTNWATLASASPNSLETTDASVGIADKLEYAALSFTQGLGSNGSVFTTQDDTKIGNLSEFNKLSDPSPVSTLSNSNVTSLSRPPARKYFRPGYSDRLSDNEKTNLESAKRFACDTYDEGDNAKSGDVRFKHAKGFEQFCSKPTTKDTRRDLKPEYKENAVYSSQFDPADPFDTAATNVGLRHYGYCVILADGTVPIKERNEYCEKPRRYLVAKGLKPKKKHSSIEYVDYSHGLLYRPLQTYSLYIFKKRNRRVRGGWELKEQRPIRISNLSPMIAVGVDRTMFSSRNTFIKFNDGVLSEIAIDKKSELLGAVEVPLKLVRAISILPTAVLQLRFNSSTQMVNLIDEQERLIRADEAYYTALKDYRDATGAAAPRSFPRSVASTGNTQLDQCLQNCDTLGNDTPSCRNHCASQFGSN